MRKKKNQLSVLIFFAFICTSYTYADKDNFFDTCKKSPQTLSLSYNETGIGIVGFGLGLLMRRHPIIALASLTAGGFIKYCCNDRRWEQSIIHIQKCMYKIQNLWGK